MLLAAGHGKSDVPAIVLEGRARHPHVEMLFGSPLSVVPELLAVAQKQLADAGALGLPLLVLARGTSDPDANAEAARAARLLAEWSGASDLELGFTGVTWPSVPDALDRMARLGHRRFAVFFWFLATGKLVDRSRDQIAQFVAGTGSDVIDAGYFGPDPALVPIIEQRHREAIAGQPRTNCDTCSYRAPWPGMEDRVVASSGRRPLAPRGRAPAQPRAPPAPVTGVLGPAGRHRRSVVWRWQDDGRNRAACRACGSRHARRRCQGRA